MAPAVAEVAPEVELPVLAQLAVQAQPAVVVDLAVEELPVEALHRSFSAAMVGNLPSTGTPRYLPVPRSGRKAKHRP